MKRPARAVTLALLALGCHAILGDPDRIIALEITGGTTHTLQTGDSLQLHARARAANGDTVTGAPIQWAVLDTGTVGISLDPGTGLVVAQAAGRWRVQAVVEDIRSDSIIVNVEEPAAPPSPLLRPHPATKGTRPERARGHGASPRPAGVVE